jgi:ABC-2 type transport system ATP-binding protein
MVDVTALCKRVIVIDHGKLVYDGDLTTLVKRVNPDKLVTLKLSRPVARGDVARFGEILDHTEAVTKLRVSSDRLRDVVAAAIAELPIADLTVEEPPLEDVMRELFAEVAERGDREAVQ